MTFLQFFIETIALDEDISNKAEAFAYANKILAHVFFNEAGRERQEKKYDIDLQISEDDPDKPLPYRWGTSP